MSRRRRGPPARLAGAIRHPYNPPAHLVGALDDWLEGPEGPPDFHAMIETWEAEARILAAAEALDRAYAEADAFDVAQRAALPEPSPEELDAETPDDWERIAGDRR